MIPGLLDVSTIVTHANCADGVASAMILVDAYRRLGKAPRVVFLNYSTPELAAFEPAPGQLWCDFAPPADRAQAFVDAGAIVLDHHLTARDVVALFGERGVYADKAAEPGVSGAVLAFREVWLRLPLAGSAETLIVEHFARLAGIRDTWQRSSRVWRQACEQAAALTFWPWEELAPLRPSERTSKLEIGPILLQKHEAEVARAARHAYRTEVAGLRLAIFEGLRLSSDVAELLGAEADLVLAFSYEGSPAPVLRVSARSRGDVDVSALARRYGGGGHTKAAGFSFLLDPLDLEDPNPFAALRFAVMSWRTGGVTWEVDGK